MGFYGGGWGSVVLFDMVFLALWRRLVRRSLLPHWMIHSRGLPRLFEAVSGASTLSVTLCVKKRCWMK